MDFDFLKMPPPPTPMPSAVNKPVRFSSEVLSSFRVAKIFRENKARINHMDYDFDGEFIVTSGDDDQIITYNCQTGTLRKGKHTIYSKKYGCGLIRFTHAKNTVLHSSTKVDDTIRYLSLHDNKYLRYFSGHTKRITSLSVSPSSDLFMSTSEDGDLRIWDLKSPNSIGVLRLPPATKSPIATFDPNGMVFAAGLKDQSGRIKLFDMRSYSQGPFVSFLFGNCEPEHEWTSLKFSPDGTSIMACNSASEIAIIDSFDGQRKHLFDAQINSIIGSADRRPNYRMDASYTPDSQFIICGSPNGILHVWDLKSTTKICTLHSDHTGPIDFVRFNPKYMMLTTTCTELAFWIPSQIDESA